MTKTEKIAKLRNLDTAYMLYSFATKLPFVECEQMEHYDQTFLYESKEDAEEAAERICAEGDIVGVTELKTEEIEVPADEDKGLPAQKKYRHQVREQLMKFPLLGLNAVFFKPAGEMGEVLELEYVLPQEVLDYVNKEKDDLIVVRLTGAYFAQYLRREIGENQQLRACAEEFQVNLVRSSLYLPVIPGENYKEGAALNLTDCRVPTYPIRKKDSGEVCSFLALFTNLDELTVHCRRSRQKARVVRIPFADVPKIINDPMIGCVIDPLSLNIPIRKGDAALLVESLGEVSAESAQKQEDVSMQEAAKTATEGAAENADAE